MTGIDFKNRRKELGLSQFRMAIKAEVSIGTIQSLEAGKISPSARTRGKLAEAYGVAPADIPPAIERAGHSAPSPS